MSRLWRCYNGKCSETGVPGFDFEAPETEKNPACPKCGVTKDHPRFGNIIVERVRIHFDAPSGIVAGRGVGFIACDPEKPVGKYRASGSPGAVNCPACRAADSFRKADHDESIHPDFEVTAEVDAKTGTIKLNKGDAGGAGGDKAKGG